MLEIKNLTLKIGEKTILDDINFQSLQLSSHNIGIIDKSGSSKSSLLKSLVALHPKSFLLKATTIKVHGYNVLNLNEKALRMLRKEVGYVPADIYGSFYPLNEIGSVFDAIIAYHHKTLTKKQRKHLSFEMMEKMGLDHLDMIWHSYIKELSGGMARRVQLALCLVCGAKMLLCDEITASLDEKNAQKIIKLLQEMRIPVVFATHHLKHLEQLCSEVLVLENGKIIEHSLMSSFNSPKSAYASS